MKLMQFSCFLVVGCFVGPESRLSFGPTNQDMHISLDIAQVRTLAEKGNVIPIFTTLPADMLTPVQCFLQWSQLKPNSFLFESVLGGEHVGRYSFIGTDPLKILQATDCDPLEEIENELAKWTAVAVPGLPDFTGGAVGYISYDCVRFFEPSTERPLRDPVCVPESIMLISDSIIVFDHLFSVVKVVSNVMISENIPIEMAFAKAVGKLESIVAALESPTRISVPQPPISSFEAVSNIGREGYVGFVEKLKKHITNGDIIQAVPSQRLKKKTNLHPFNAYRTLRTVNPSPYMFYIDYGDFQLVGASPEMMVKVTPERRVETHPIAGTRHRGETEVEDQRLAEELLADHKERSEHIMVPPLIQLVDLGRNDINRVCEPDTVKVDSLMHIEKYAHVMHIVSCVGGILRPDQTQFDAFRSVFPAGTLSGAPKVRAMQLIYELEKEKRGVYGGAVGYFGFSKTIDTCIAIRTMVFKNGHVYLQAGGGIVHDSDAEAEYIETINKLKSNVVALEKAENACKQ